MATAAVLDFAKLLAPIPGPNPAGADLRADASPGAAYYATKDARNKARADERKMVAGDEADTPPPDWKPVVQNATKALGEKSKDLEITAYLIEGQCRLNGFAGLRDGFRLARELCEKFWDQLYPLPDEEGIETRVAPLTGLNGEDAEGTLIAPIAKIPLTESRGAPAFAAYHYQEALAVAKIADPKAKERRVEAGAATLEKIQAAVGESSNRFYTNLVEDLNQALDEFGKLGAVLDGKCGGKAPPTGNIRAALTNALDVVKNIAQHKLEQPAAAKPEAKADGGAAPAAAGAAAPQQKPADLLQTREDAFNLLLKVAEFFRKTEPHTPVSYAIEQAVRWGKMPLPDLLAELVPEENPRKAMFKQVGIRPPEPKDEKKK